MRRRTTLTGGFDHATEEALIRCNRGEAKMLAAVDACRKQLAMCFEVPARSIMAMHAPALGLETAEQVDRLLRKLIRD